MPVQYPAFCSNGQHSATCVSGLLSHAVLCAMCLVQIIFGRDGNFSEVAFRDTVNACLANSIGNMLNRWG